MGRLAPGTESAVCEISNALCRNQELRWLAVNSSRSTPSGEVDNRSRGCSSRLHARRRFWPGVLFRCTKVGAIEQEPQGEFYLLRLLLDGSEFPELTASLTMLA